MATLWLGLGIARAAEQPLPSGVAAALRGSGLPLKSFGFHVQPVEGDAAAALASLNSEQPFLLASTAKLVTSLAALELLGPAHRWRTEAFATGPVVNGRLAGNLVIVGGAAGLTPAELGRWFRQMRAEGLTEISGHIVLERVSLLHELHPAQAATTRAERAPAEFVDSADYNKRAIVVTAAPTRGARATVRLTPHPAGVTVVNEVTMGGGCAAWARWRSDAPSTRGGALPPQLWVSGRWDTSCGRRQIAFVRLPASATLAAAQPAPPVTLSSPRLVATLWAQTGGTLRGKVIETQHRRARLGEIDAEEPWVSEASTALPELIREINKTSNNIAARSLLLSLASGPSSNTPLLGAQTRVNAWLRTQGLADGDIRIDVGSGQSRNERGKPRAMVQLLLNAWRGVASKVFVDSLPIAGVDGTLAHRMRSGLAAGHAHLKTGTLRDTRALAGYVRAKSGKVYAVAAIVNHPLAARATPTLDAFIEWVAKNG
ncbi:serine-type D-Ala-D-Ala carboxypeptidase/endopeptidase (penicillin-binding protein 4) [Burkholderiaceae bacterium]|nr:serine-type D-Ala-D-Ala carboxypeptidase/endopeptidase (penicillin-binding protein 4) [Burkholderiaceae bacterium]